MRQHPTGQVIAEAMNHITILAWTGGKGKRMEYKILNEKCYYTRADLCTTTRSIKIRESDAQIRLHIFC